MRGLAILVLLLAAGLLAGCLEESTAPPMTPLPPSPGLVKERFFGAQVDGPVSIQTTFTLAADSVCSFAGFAHTLLHVGYTPDLAWDLARLEKDGPVSVAGSPLPIPYPQARLHAGPADTRPVTSPARDVVWDTYFSVAFGEQNDFVTWNGYKDQDLAAGTYLFTAYSPTAVVASGNSLVGDSSLGTGLQCNEPFRVDSESYGTQAVLLTPYGVQGDVDVGTEVFGSEVHKGSLQFTATGNDTMLWTEGARIVGEVAYSGPVSERLSMDHLDTPNVNVGSQPIPRYWRWLPAGEYDLSWDLTSPGTPYWVLGLSSYQQAPQAWTLDSWGLPN